MTLQTNNKGKSMNEYAAAEFERKQARIEGLENALIQIAFYKQSPEQCVAIARKALAEGVTTKDMAENLRKLLKRLGMEDVINDLSG